METSQVKMGNKLCQPGLCPRAFWMRSLSSIRFISPNVFLHLL